MAKSVYEVTVIPRFRVDIKYRCGNIGHVGLTQGLAYPHAPLGFSIRGCGSDYNHPLKSPKISPSRSLKNQPEKDKGDKVGRVARFESGTEGSTGES